jgi:hypothetical protein
LAALRDGNFASVACKIHQHFTKDSLKINQVQKNLKEYLATVDYGSTTLIRMTVACKKKTICKSIAGLKYIEAYCFGLFKVFYQETMKEVCPVPFYIQEILENEKLRKK